MPITSLEFTKSLSRLAGNEFGEKTFKEQVKDNFDYNEKNIIKFPDTIEYIAISFIQGFIKGILDNSSMNKDELLNIIEFKAKNEKVLAKIMRSLRY